MIDTQFYKWAWAKNMLHPEITIEEHIDNLIGDTKLCYVWYLTGKGGLKRPNRGFEARLQDALIKVHGWSEAPLLPQIWKITEGGLSSFFAMHMQNLISECERSNQTSYVYFHDAAQMAQSGRCEHLMEQLKEIAVVKSIDELLMESSRQEYEMSYPLIDEIKASIA